MLIGSWMVKIIYIIHAVMSVLLCMPLETPPNNYNPRAPSKNRHVEAASQTLSL